MLYLYGRSGTMYLYIHLNNDLTARNDNIEATTTPEAIVGAAGALQLSRISPLP